MSLSKKYKKVEKAVFSFASKYTRVFFKGIKISFDKIVVATKLKFTVMLIPHSEKKIINFKISALMLCFLTVFSVLLLSTFIISGILFSMASKDSRENKAQLSMVEQNNRNYHQAIENFNRPYRTFESTLNDILKNQLPPEMTSKTRRTGDYLDIEIIEETKDGQTPLTSILENATEDIEVYTRALIERSQQESKIGELLKIIPAKWPISNNQGRITAHFGPAPHPIKRMWYLHTGIDIAFTRGTPIIATANGKVVEQQFNRDYGNYVIIRHEYGFYSKYAHMDLAHVKVGDTVLQGQSIGILGNTGLSSGPHLHYEIMINSQNIDPYKYIQLLKQ